MLITIGKKAIRNAISTFGKRPNPNHTSRSGATATFGMACDDTSSGRIERENGGQRKIASASGMPTTMLSRNPSRISTVVTQPLCSRSAALFSIETPMALGGGRRKTGTWNARIAISQRASRASTTLIGETTAEIRARNSRRARSRCAFASTSSMRGGAYCVPEFSASVMVGTWSGMPFLRIVIPL